MLGTLTEDFHLETWWFCKVFVMMLPGRFPQRFPGSEVRKTEHLVHLVRDAGLVL